jgi:outer membrane protein OmpA-like peptidoglycan-associated protein
MLNRQKTMTLQTYLHDSCLTGSASRFCGIFFCLLLLSACTTPLPNAKVSEYELPLRAETQLSASHSEANASTALNVNQEEKPEVLIEDNNIYFPLRVTDVNDIGKGKLRLHAQNLKKDLKQVVNLIGHIDDSGSRSYNLAITEQRLDNVIKLLRLYGVSPRQIRRQSVRRETMPASCTTPDCQQKFRRVELLFLH